MCYSGTDRVDAETAPTGDHCCRFDCMTNASVTLARISTMQCRRTATLYRVHSGILVAAANRGCRYSWPVLAQPKAVPY